MQALQGFTKQRKSLAALHLAIQPLRQNGNTGQGLRDGAPQHFRGKARSQGIDRFKQRKPVGLPGQGDVVGMHHGGAAVEPFHTTADDDVFADRHGFLQIGGMRVEKGEADLTGVVMRIDAVRHGAVAARRRLVAVDAQVERDDGAGR